MTMGSLSRERLKLAGLTQRQLAVLAKVSDGHLSLVLSGERPASPRLLKVWVKLVEPRIREHIARELEGRARASRGDG